MYFPGGWPKEFNNGDDVIQCAKFSNNHNLLFVLSTKHLSIWSIQHVFPIRE